MASYLVYSLYRIPSILHQQPCISLQDQNEARIDAHASVMTWWLARRSSADIVLC